MRKFLVQVNGARYEVGVEEITNAPAIEAAPKTEPVAPAASAPAGGKTILSPMPGTILQVAVKAGDAVKRGQLLMVLEAMKMENEIQAPADCIVASVSVQAGATVSTGQLLLTLG